MTDVPPDRLSVDPSSPFYDEAALARGIGVRFRGVERRDVEEYSVSEGWIRAAAGKALDRRGQPLVIKMTGAVEPYFLAPSGRRSGDQHRLSEPPMGISLLPSGRRWRVVGPPDEGSGASYGALRARNPHPRPLSRRRGGAVTRTVYAAAIVLREASVGDETKSRRIRQHHRPGRGFRNRRRRDAQREVLGMGP